jgi:hypothetical protein
VVQLLEDAHYTSGALLPIKKLHSSESMWEAKSWKSVAWCALVSRLALLALCVVAEVCIPDHVPTGAAHYPNTQHYIVPSHSTERREDSSSSSASSTAHLTTSEHTHTSAGVALPPPPLPLPMEHWTGRWLVGFTRWDSAHLLSLAHYGCVACVCVCVCVCMCVCVYIYIYIYMRVGFFVCIYLPLPR